MAGPFICIVCGEKEQDCRCDRYCTICQSDHNVRLCLDGNYYCKDCRDACDYEAQN